MSTIDMQSVLTNLQKIDWFIGPCKEQIETAIQNGKNNTTLSFLGHGAAQLAHSCLIQQGLDCTEIKRGRSLESRYMFQICWA